MRRAILVAAVVAAAGMAIADTVTIAPGNGVFTNVTARIAGETDVEINSGTSGGGIVRLNAANGYVGTTTVNCGTLVVDSVAETGNNVGAGGWLAADGEQEKEAHLEIRGGKVQFTSWFMHACYNGKTSTTPQKRTASSVRIYAGDFTMGGGTFAMGRSTGCGAARRRAGWRRTS